LGTQLNGWPIRIALVVKYYFALLTDRARRAVTHAKTGPAPSEDKVKARWSESTFVRRRELKFFIVYKSSKELFFSCIKFISHALPAAKVKTRKNWPVTRLPEAKTR